MSDTSLPQFTYLYQSINGEVNFPRFVKYPPELGGWCDLFAEIEHLDEAYVTRQLEAGRVRTHKIDLDAEADTAAYLDHLDTQDAVRP